MRGSRLLVIGWTLVVCAAFFGCRTARGPKGMLPPGAVADFTRIYTGQMRILPGFGEESRISLARGAALPTGGCDMAVLIMSAVLEGGTARLELEPVGFPRIEVRPAVRECRKAPRDQTLVVTRLEADAPIERLSEEIDRVLQTPERYLVDRGVAFAYAPVTKLGPIADKRLHTNAEERSLARAITQPAKRLLSVAPIRREKRKAMRYQGEVTFVAVVGSDGRLHDPHLVAEYGEHEDRIMKVLGLWRYEPARRKDELIAFRTEERTSLRVY